MSSLSEGEFLALALNGIEAVVHDRADHVLVRIQHWCAVAEQVLAEQLWVQVSHFPHLVPHAGLFASQLRRHRLAEAGADAECAIPGSVLEDFDPQSGFLCLGGQR